MTSALLRQPGGLRLFARAVFEALCDAVDTKCPELWPELLRAWLARLWKRKSD